MISNNTSLNSLSLNNRCLQLTEIIGALVFQLQLEREGNYLFTYISPQIETLFGLTVAEILANPDRLIPLLPREELSLVHNILAESAITLKPWSWEGHLNLPNGKVKWFRGGGIPEKLTSGTIVWDCSLVEIPPQSKAVGLAEEDLIDAIAHNVTKQKETEALMTEQNRIIQSILNSISDGVIVSDLEGNFLVFNPAAEKIFGMGATEEKPEEWSNKYGLFLSDQVTPFPVDKLPLVLACQGESTDNVEIFVRHSNVPQGLWCNANGRPVKDEQGTLRGGVVICRDVTEKKEADELLRQSEQRYQMLAEASPICVFYTDAQGSCIYTNERSETIIGLTKTAALAQGWAHYLHPEDRERVFQEWAQAATNNVPFKSEYRFQHQDGKVVWVIGQALAVRDDEDKVTGYVGTITDITDRKLAEIELQQQTEDLERTLNELQQTQTQLIQSEKMSSLGQLLAGVAHEINNPVNFIYGNLIHAQEYSENLLGMLQAYSQFYPNPVPELQDLLEDNDVEFLLEDFPRLLESMKVGCQRIREIVASLRNFSRLDESESKEANIEEGLDSTLMILQNRIKARSEHPAIEVSKNYGNLPLVECYPGQLNQVFMNILVNAIDAIEETYQERSYSEIQKNPGHLTITTTLLEGGERVQIRLKDNGIGMKEETCKRIFDPFYTTKAIGKGTGLGMSISYQIITERHQGSIECLSAPGEGAEFIIEIPRKQNH